MEILIGDPLICIMSHPKLISSDQIEEAISAQSVTLGGVCVLLVLHIFTCCFTFCLFFIYLCRGSGGLFSFEFPLPVNRAIVTCHQMCLRYACAKSDASLEHQ